MNTIADEDSAQQSLGVSEPTRWFRLLSRWSLVLALATLVLSVMFLFVIGQLPSDIQFGLEYAELFQAIRIPTAFRLVWTLDAIIWILIGGSLMIMGGSLRRRDPVIAVIIQISGIAQIIGFLGTLIRLHGTIDLAVAYSSVSPDQLEAVLKTYLDLWRIVKSFFYVPVMFSGLGFLLSASCFFRVRGFPRWLAVWIALPGILGISQFILTTAGLPKLDVLNFLGVGLGNIALNFALAISLWRSSKDGLWR